MIRMSPLPPSRRQTSLVSSVPESTSLEATKAPFGAERIDVDRLAVDIDDRDAGIVGELGHRRGGRGVDRVDDDRIDLGGDEVLDLRQLLLHVVIGDFDLDRLVGVRRRLLDALAQHRQERRTAIEDVDRAGEGRARQDVVAAEGDQDALRR